MTGFRHRMLSTRLVVRQVSELLLARYWRWQALVPQERLASLTFEVVLSASIGHRPLRNPASGEWLGVEDSATLGRPVNATAIAHSMGLPHTTIRRRAGDLAAAGFLVRNAAGFSVAADAFVKGALEQLAVEDARDLARMLSALADAGYAPAAEAGASLAKLPAGVVERALLVFALRVMESFTALYGDATTGTIMAAIIAANVRHVTENPELARAYAAEDVLPPDDLRQPISLRALSQALAMPFETLRRRANVLVAEGSVAWKRGGIIVPASVLSNDRHLDNNRRIMLHFERFLEALVSLAAPIR